jgi:hypothetical protein
MNTNAPKIVRIKIVNSGTHFACIAIIKARNGRTIWTGPARPYGLTDAARKVAEAKCEEMGWTVAEEAS